MSDRLRLFVSVGPDLEQEREYIGQAVARLPISLGWAIQYTPGLQEKRGVDSEPIVNCHLHVVLLGMDIVAPVGWELWIAHRTGHASLGLLKEVVRTPAATAFLRESDMTWIPFRGPAELIPLLQRTLGERLVEDPVHYGLPLTEWEALSAFLKAQSLAETERAGEETRRGGAGRSGLILSPGHDLPPGGVLVGENVDKEVA